MSLQIHIVPQDLAPSETRRLVVESLLELREAMNAVFERVQAQIAEERGTCLSGLHQAKQ